MYPEEETEVSVSLADPGRLTCAYPETDVGWDVLAELDGTLTDLSTGRSLYALYYEAEADDAEVGEAEEVAGRIRKQDIDPVDRTALDGFVAVKRGGTEVGSGCVS